MDRSLLYLEVPTVRLFVKPFIINILCLQVMALAITLFMAFRAPIGNQDEAGYRPGTARGRKVRKN